MRLSDFFYINILMPRVSHSYLLELSILEYYNHVLNIWGLEYDMSRVLPLCGVDYHICLILTYSCLEHYKCFY